MTCAQMGEQESRSRGRRRENNPSDVALQGHLVPEPFRLLVGVSPDGAIPGKYASQVVWKGRLDQWNQKVQALNQRAKTLDLGKDGNACLNAITECKADEINVVFYTRGRAK